MDKEQVNAASEAELASELIQKLPDGFESLVGEKGMKLSGGQRHRLAIARALYKDSPIVIMDEATLALDAPSEMLVKDAFE